MLAEPVSSLYKSENIYNSGNVDYFTNLFNGEQVWSGGNTLPRESYNKGVLIVDCCRVWSYVQY